MKLSCYYGVLRLCDQRGTAAVIGRECQDGEYNVMIRAVNRFCRPETSHSNIGAAEQHGWIFHHKEDIAVTARVSDESLEESIMRDLANRKSPGTHRD